MATARCNPVSQPSRTLSHVAPTQDASQLVAAAEQIGGRHVDSGSPLGRR